ncbi:MAG: hypothetical protein IH614_11290 [Desulfuromonadales bacterium]|nr:hypothetical protein [Desulfuromonadales bacterium]
MKIRSSNELIDFLAGRRKERKRELISLSQDIADARKSAPHYKRAAVVLSYAHWEGFVKDAASAYVFFVSHKSKKLSDLIVNFQALACRQELMCAQIATRRLSPHINVARRFTEDLDRTFNINADNVIDTESNLSSIVFENICACVGINYHRAWATDGPFMDDLLKNRCAVAHGELYTPTNDYALETLSFTIKSIDRFSTDIENEAINEAYLRSSATQLRALEGGANGAVS